ncbi:MAG: hypothetical protein ACK5NI_02410, partial [bacterium]
MDNQSQNPIQFTPQLSNKAKKALSRLRKAQECLKDAPILDEIQAMIGKGPIATNTDNQDDATSNNSSITKQTSTTTTSEPFSTNKEPFSTNKEQMDSQEIMVHSHPGNNPSIWNPYPR